MATTQPTGASAEHMSDLTEPTITERAKTALNDAGETLKSVGETAQQKAADAKEKASEHAKQAGETARELQDDFVETVRRNPWIAIGGALGVGLAVGLLLNKRD